MSNHNKVKPIALYLPQYHPIPENDAWWEKGFTEWTNVTKSRPKFKGHYQPHLPTDMGFYDLRVTETHLAQAALAKEYGIYGFCYYHYWFNSKLLLEKPLEIVLKNPQIKMPFCLCWANENWSRRWDGNDSDLLLEQHYSPEDDFNHIQYLLPFFQDERYIKVDGKPVFLMYRTELHPDIHTAVNTWRTEAKKAGFPDLYLIRVENFVKNVDPQSFSFDAGLEFAPDCFKFDSSQPYKNKVINKIMQTLNELGIYKNERFENNVYQYKDLVDYTLNKSNADYKHFRSVCPSWDNSARRETKATIFKDSTPQLFEYWLKETVKKTTQTLNEDERFVFINAWNEWAEGCHLEPDRKWGRAYLEAVKNSLL